MKLKSKLFAGVVGAAMVLSTVAIPASAQTTAELTAQINSLLAMIAQLQAQIAGGTPTAGAGASMTFTSDLTIGSTGAEVSALQQWLVSRGYLVMPAGVAMGYFGPLTQSALAKYQAEAGISPAAGYFGPITRAKVNAMAGTPGTPTTPGTTTPGAGITTPGVEGTLSVTSNNSGVVSTAREGDTRAVVMGMRVEAKTSDIAVQRVRLNLGSSTKIFNKIYSALHVVDGSNVLASVDLNSSTVVKDGSDYIVTITGFNFVVPRNSTRTLQIAADVRSTIDTNDANTSYTITVPANGIRGVDGAGIDQFAPASSFSRSVQVEKSLTDTATIKTSLNNASPKKAEVIASSGALKNEMDNLTVLVFDVKAEKDNVLVTDMAVNIATSSGTATVQTARLFDGSTEIDNASVVGGVATFNDVDVNVSKDATKTFTVKVDVRTAGTVATTITASTGTITAENSKGDSITGGNNTGSATGHTISVRNRGVEVSLVSKSIATSGVPQGSTSQTLSTSTLTATFNVKVKALGGDIALGTIASGTPLFSRTGGADMSFVIYKNGVAVSSALVMASSSSFTIPSTCTSFGTNSCLLSEGSEVTVPVTFQIPGRLDTGVAHDSALYSIGLERVNWGNGQSTAFMAGEVDWRTNDVSFP